VLLDHLHDGRPGEELGDGSRPEQRLFRIDRRALGDIGIAEAARGQDLAVFDDDDVGARYVRRAQGEGKIAVEPIVDIVLVSSCVVATVAGSPGAGSTILAVGSGTRVDDGSLWAKACGPAATRAIPASKFLRTRIVSPRIDDRGRTPLGRVALRSISAHRDPDQRIVLAEMCRVSIFAN
jgi:hypothetical protein